MSEGLIKTGEEVILIQFQIIGYNLKQMVIKDVVLI